MSVPWDVDFSLALHNRTGKYYLGRDLLTDQADLVRRVHYWRRSPGRVPAGLEARVIGRLLAWEIRARRSSAAARRLPRFRPARPVLHLDPFTVLFSELSASDMVLCHDLGPITHPDLFAPAVTDLYHRAYAEIVDKGPRMAFVSRASRDAFVALHGPAADSRVIYPAVRTEIGGDGDGDGDGGRAVEGVEPPFLLTVGSIGRRKNQALTIRAFARSGLAREGVRYVVCGAREPGFDAAAEAAAGTPGVHLLPYVSDAELAWLYGHAAGFVLTSRLEGFGIPVAEAIARGLVPLVSEGGVLEEVAGEAALTADPDDEAAVAEGLRTLAGMTEGERGSLRPRLREAVGRFTREAFARGWREALTA